MKIKSSCQNSIYELSIVSAVFLGLSCIFFFALFKSGFDLLPGDAGDALLNILSADSWRDVWTGKVSFCQNRIYYPFQYGRGFTDLSLSLFIFTLPWRYIFNCDAYSSALAVHISLFVFGFFSMYYLNRKVLGYSLCASLCGSVFAFFSSAFIIKLGHTQFFFMGMLPLLAICLIKAGEHWSLEKRVGFICWTSAAAAVFSCIALSNYYTAFFAGLFILIAFAVALKQKDFRKHIEWQALKKHIPELLIAGIISLLLMLPFLYAYYPIINADYSRNWTAAQGTLPVLSDILNIGKDNLLWGKLYELYFPPIHKNIYENCYGIPPFTLFLTAVLSFCYWKNKNLRTPAITVLWITLAVMYILSLKVYHAVSLWYFIWEFVPGGSAIRAGGRIYVFMMFPLAVFLAYMVNKTFVFKSNLRLFAVCAACLVIFSADNYSGFSLFNWSCSQIRNKAASLPPPPEDIEVFYLTDSARGVPSDANWGKYGMTAWLIARHHQIFSINGCSGNAPANFRATDPLAPDYQKEINRWINIHKLKNTGSYDITTKVWKKHNQAIGLCNNRTYKFNSVDSPPDKPTDAITQRTPFFSKLSGL